jgi:arylsulfatase A-like enzyme
MRPVSPWIVLALLPLLVAPLRAADPAPARRPNFVVVLVDDAGWADFPFGAGQPIRTPQIDRLARQGLRFTQFYVNSPLCSPSRAALTTGLFPQRTGITSYIDNRAANRRRGIRDWLDPATFTAPRALQAAGYATGHFGKWHLGGGRDVADAPLISEYGFDASLTQFEGLGDRVLPLVPNGQGGADKLPLGVQSAELGRGDVQWRNRDEVTAAFVDRAVEFIRNAEAEGRPFYVNLWPDDVHTPLVPAPKDRPQRTKRDRYLAVLENMDAQLAPLFDELRARPALRDNTVLLLMSDNGPEAGAGSAAPLRGGKGELYEGGIREPLVVWGPGWIDPAAAGATNDASVLSTVDVVASLLALAGVERPVSLDGEDLSATLCGASHAGRSAPLVWVRPPDRPTERDEDLPDLAVREGRWKLLVNRDGTDRQLYDIEADPSETTDAAMQHATVADRLARIALDAIQTVAP